MRILNTQSSLRSDPGNKVGCLALLFNQKNVPSLVSHASHPGHLIVIMSGSKDQRLLRETML